MSLITNNSTPAERSRGLVFSELFENAEKIVQNEGVITGAPVINNGATFDGTNDWITYDSPPFSTVVSGNSFSVVIDFDITVDHGALQCLVEWGPGTAADSVMVLLDTNNYLRLYVGNGVSIFTGTAVTSGRHTLTAYWDGSNRDMYLDGASVGKTSPGATGVTTVGTKIGARLDNSLPLNGTIYSAKVFKTELTLQEHTDYYNNATYRYINEAVLDLPMGMAEHDPTNTRTDDISGNGLNGTLSGTSLTKNTDQWGYNLPGTDEFIDVGDTSQNIKTVSFWIKPNSDTEEIMDLDAGTHTIEAASGTLTATGFSSPTIYVNGEVSSALVPYAWQLVTVTTATAIDTDNLDIGRISTTYLTGDIARVKMSTSELTALQIKDLYQREFKKINVT